MFLFGSSSKEGKYSVLFEICSASVGAAIAVHEANTVRLLWSKRLEFGYASEDDYVRYVRSMYAALLELGMQVTSEGFQHAREVRPDFSARNVVVHCVLAPPWFFGAVDFQTVTKEKPFQVNQTILTKVKNEGYSTICNSDEFASWEDLMGAPMLLEYYADAMKVDGYKVANAEHVTTKELFVQSYYSVVSESIQAHIAEVVERVLPNHSVIFLSSTRLLSTLPVQYEEKNTSHRIIFLEIKGEITSLVLLRDEVLENIISIPLGTNHVLRKLSPKAISMKESQDALEMLLQRTGNSDFSAFPKELQDVLMEWHASVEFSLRALTRGVAPPTSFYLFVDSLWGGLYERTLMNPFKMPGTRSPVDIKTYTLGSMQEKVKSKHPQKEDTNDIRLHMYAQLLWG